MSTVNVLKGHFRGVLNTVFIDAGRTELRMATERDKFKIAAVLIAIHGATIRRTPTV